MTKFCSEKKIINKAHLLRAMGPNVLNGSVRKCIHSAFRIFESIPKVVDPNNVINDEYRNFIMQESEQFRGVLSALNSDINSIAESLDNEANCNGGLLDHEYDLICNLEQSWHICEVFLLNPTKHISIETARWLKTSLRQYPVELAIEQMKTVDQPELLKASTLDVTTFNYWDIVYKMVAQGNTLLACEALSLHSEFAQLLNNPSNIRMTGGVDRAHCQSLFDAILTHPFIPLINGEMNVQDESILLSQQSQMLNKFNAWSDKVRRLRASNNALLMRIPQLDTILRILLGEIETLNEVVDRDWMGLTLSMLLFVYPPPLTRSNLGQIVEEALSHQDREQTESEASFSQAMRDIISGNVGAMLRSLYEQGQKYYSLSATSEINREIDSDVEALSIRRDITTVSLLSVAHLTLLLVHGADKADLLLPLEGGGSFVEQLFLEAAERLSAMEVTNEMVLGYLAVCPTQGRHTARVLLTRLQIYSDQEAVLTAQSLQALNWVQDSRHVLLNRANYWLQKTHSIFKGGAYCQSLNVLPKDVVTDVLRSNQNTPQSSVVVSSSSSSSSSRPELTYSHVISKAVYFLKMARDVTFIDDIIDRSLYQLMSAVAVCKPLFKDLSLLPMAPVPRDDATFQYRPVVHKKDRLSFTSDEEFVLIHHLQSTLQESLDLLETLHDTHHTHSVYTSECTEDETAHHVRSVEMLTSYVKAISTTLYERDNLDKMFAAVSAVAALVTKEQNEVPYRYYLHLLDLTAWLSVAIADLKRAQKFIPTTAEEVVEEEDVMRTDDTTQQIKSTTTTSSSGSHVLSKPVAYQLVTALTRITSSHAFERLLSGCGGVTKDVQTLRLQLLGQIATSLIQDNADSHVNREYSRRLNGGLGGPGGGMMRADVFLRNRVPLAFRNQSSSSSSTGIDELNVPVQNGFAFYRAAGLPTETHKALKVRRELTVSDYLGV